MFGAVDARAEIVGDGNGTGRAGWEARIQQTAAAT